jgi:WD40 repeat protein
VNAPYDAFVSYSHAADARIAAALQSALQRLAKPWYRRRALAVFRDDTNLAASPGLWSEIERALDRSGAFILIASPEAAASGWIEREVAHWRSTKPMERFFIAITAGSIAWDGRAGDFDWTRTTAIPRNLAGAFPEEPLHVDLRFARDGDSADPRHARFRTAAARLGAPLRGLTLDELISEDTRLQRRAVRLAAGAGAALFVLAVVASVSGVLAVSSRREAERRATTAIAHRVALEGMVAEVVGQQSDLGLLLSLQSLRIEPSSVAYRNVLTVLASVNEGEVYLHAPGQTLRAVTFSSDGTLVFALTARDEVLAWRLSDPRQPRPTGEFDEQHGIHAARAGAEVLVPLEGEATAVDRTSRVGVTSDETVRTFRVGGRALAKLPIDADSVSSVAVSRGGAIVGLGGTDGAITLWNARTGALQTKIAPPAKGARRAAIRALALSPDARRIAAAGTDGRLSLWEVAPGGVTEAILKHLHTEANQLVFNDDATSLLVAYGNTLEQFDLASSRSEILAGFPGLIHGVAVSPNGARIAVGGRDAVLVWNFAEREMFRRPFNSPHAASVVAAAMLADGRRGRTLDYDGLLVDWDFGTVPATARSFRLPSSRPIGGLAQFSRDGRWLVTANGRQVVRWHVSDSGASAQGTVASQREVHAVAFSASGDVVAIASSGASVEVVRFDAHIARPVWSGTLEDTVSSLALSHDGAWLAAGYEARGFVVRNLRSGEQRSTTRGHDGRITGLAFDDRSGLVATAGEDRTIGVWKILDLSRVKELRGTHAEGAATSVIFNPVTGQLLSSGGDALINLWPASGNGDEAVPVPLIGHERPAHALAFSPDGRRLLAGDGNWRVFMWEIDAELWRRRACALVNRNLTENEWRMHVGRVPYQKTCD